MDKVTLVFSEPKNRIVKYGESYIEVKPYLGIDEQYALIENYVNSYFRISNQDSHLTSTRYDYLAAEYNLRHSIVDLLTNIDIYSVSTNMYDNSGYDPMKDGLWDVVVKEIGNYKEFYSRLNKVVDDYKQELTNENAVGSVIKSLSDKAVSLLEGFSKFTPDDIERAKDAGLSLLREIEKSPLKPTRSKRVAK